MPDIANSSEEEKRKEALTEGLSVIIARLKKETPEIKYEESHWHTIGDVTGLNDPQTGIERVPEIEHMSYLLKLNPTDVNNLIKPLPFQGESATLGLYYDSIYPIRWLKLEIMSGKRKMIFKSDIFEKDNKFSRPTVYSPSLYETNDLQSVSKLIAEYIDFPKADFWIQLATSIK